MIKNIHDIDECFDDQDLLDENQFLDFVFLQFQETQQLSRVLEFQAKDEQSVKQVMFINTSEKLAKRLSREKKNLKSLQMKIHFSGAKEEQVVESIR